MQKVGEFIWIMRHSFPGVSGWLAVFISLMAIAITIARAPGWLASALAYTFRELRQCRLGYENLGFARVGLCS